VIRTGDDRAFNRGLRIVAGFTARLVVVAMIVVIQRNRPLGDSHLNPAADHGPLPHAGSVPTHTSGVVQHPGKSDSDLPSQP